MDNAKTALIWDLDGTLMDSYDVIASSIVDSFAAYGVKLDWQEMRDDAIKGSVSGVIMRCLEGTGVTYEQIREVYGKRERELSTMLKPMPYAHELIEELNARGVENYIFTHRGTTTEESLKQIGLDGMFREVITSRSGFPRKPAPDAIDYLVEKYGLDRDHTYYVGDRRLDVECAQCAGVRSIFFLYPGSVLTPMDDEDYVVHDMRDIRELMKTVEGV